MHRYNIFKAEKNRFSGMQSGWIPCAVIDKIIPCDKHARLWFNRERERGETCVAAFEVRIQV